VVPGQDVCRKNALANLRGINSRKCPTAVLSVFLQLIFPVPAYAQSAPRNLDLSSTTQSVTANIIMGGTNRQVNVNDMITPAESFAISQVLNTGRQSIVAGSQGNDTGGTFILSYAARNGTSNLGACAINRIEL
jgi:hypothetical protein